MDVLIQPSHSLTQTIVWVVDLSFIDIFEMCIAHRARRLNFIASKNINMKNYFLFLLVLDFIFACLRWRSVACRWCWCAHIHRLPRIHQCSLRALTAWQEVERFFSSLILFILLFTWRNCRLCAVCTVLDPFVHARKVFLPLHRLVVFFVSLFIYTSCGILSLFFLPLSRRFSSPPSSRLRRLRVRFNWICRK